MTPVLKNSLPIALLVLCTTACGSDGGGRLPMAPSTTLAPAWSPAPVSPNAVPIGLGETVARVVTESDPPVDTTWGPEPGARFTVAVPSSGVLRVSVTSPGPTGLTLWVNSVPFWGTVHDVFASTRVMAGATYEIAVSIHDVHSTSQPFELTTSLDPQ